MIDITKNYWLYIAPYVYCSIKNNHALLYNTKTGANMESDEQGVIDLLQLLHEKKNLGAIHFEGRKLKNDMLKSFITEYCSCEMGGLIEIIEGIEKPIQMMPILNLQCDVAKIQSVEERNTGEEVLQNLLELNIYLNSNCKQNCLHCTDNFRQSLCCRANNEQCVLDISLLRNVLSEIQYGVVGKLNLLGGNVFEYPYYKELMNELTNFKEKIHIWTHYGNFANHYADNSDCIFDIVVTFPTVEFLWERFLLNKGNLQFKFHFFITTAEEYAKSNIMIEEYNISNYSIHPVYVKNNHYFFREFIYINQEDIFQTKLSFDRIFANQKLNTHFFGSLTILESGNVYANVNKSLLGNVSRDRLLDVVNNEMRTNTAWRQVRNGEPCKKCNYQFICPSPSNYEIVIGKPNLCHIKS